MSPSLLGANTVVVVADVRVTKTSNASSRIGGGSTGKKADPSEHAAQMLRGFVLRRENLNAFARTLRRSWRNLCANEERKELRIESPQEFRRLWGAPSSQWAEETALLLR